MSIFTSDMVVDYSEKTQLHLASKPFHNSYWLISQQWAMKMKLNAVLA